jgi:hypothetical protein
VRIGLGAARRDDHLVTHGCQSFGAWGEVFGDRVIATAILDRPATSRCHAEHPRQLQQAQGEAQGLIAPVLRRRRIPTGWGSLNYRGKFGCR